MDCIVQATRVDGRSLLQGIFPTQGSNPGLFHCRWILYQLSHQRSPRILEWVAYPFSRGYSWPRNQTTVSCTAGRFFTSPATRTGSIPQKNPPLIHWRISFWCFLLFSRSIYTYMYTPSLVETGVSPLYMPFCKPLPNLILVYLFPNKLLTNSGKTTKHIT